MDLLSTYTHTHLPHHAILAGRRDRAFGLVMEESFRSAQVKETDYYDATLGSLEAVLYAEQERTLLQQSYELDTEEARDEQLLRYAKLLKTCGDVGHQAETDLEQAWQWAEKGEIDKAIRRLNPIKDEDRLFKAYFLLLWITVDAENLSDEQKKENCEKVLKEIEERIPEGTGTVDWSEWNEHNTVVNVLIGLYDLGIDLGIFLERGSIGTWLLHFIEIIIQKGGYEYAFDIVSKFNGEDYGNIKIIAMEKIASSLAEIGEYFNAAGLASGISESYYRSKALSSIALSFSKVDDNKRAIDFFEKSLHETSKIDNTKDKSIALGYIAKLIAESGEHKQAHNLFNQALQVASGIDDVGIKSEILALIAASLADSGDHEWSHDMFDLAIEAASEDWNLKSIASSLAESGDYSRAIIIASGLNDINKSDALSEIASYMAKACHFDRAIDIANSIDDKYSMCKSDAWTSIASSMVKAGYHERAHDIYDIEFNRARNVFLKALKPVYGISDDREKTEVLGCIASYHAKSGNNYQANFIFKLALNIAVGIDDVLRKLEAIEKIILYLVEVGYYKHSIEIAFRIEEDWKKSECLTCIALSLAKSGEDSLSNDIFDQALKIAYGIEEEWRKTKLLAYIASSLAITGVYDRSIEIVSKIDCSFEKSDSLLKIALTLFDSGFHEQASDVFNQSLQVASGIETLSSIGRYYDKSPVYARIASYMALSGYHDHARHVFESALQISYEFETDYDKSTTQALIALYLAKAGYDDQALIVFNQSLRIASGINNSVLKSDALFTLASYVIDIGHHEIAIEIEQMINRRFEKSEIKALIVYSLCKSGDYDRAIDIAYTINDNYSKSNAVKSISEWLIDFNDIGNIYKLIFILRNVDWCHISFKSATQTWFANWPDQSDAEIQPSPLSFYLMGTTWLPFDRETSLNAVGYLSAMTAGLGKTDLSMELFDIFNEGAGAGF